MSTLRKETDLRPAQERTITELMASIGVQAVLPMGAGKTAAALTAIRRMIDAKTIRAAIVIAPRRVALETWPNETTLWEHLRDTDLVVLSGGPAVRAKRLAEPHEVYVIGIDNVQWLIDTLSLAANRSHPGWDVLVIDEISRFKNPRGQRAHSLMQVAARFGTIWGLTGTPRPNSDEDLWMPLQIVSAGAALPRSFDKWRRSNFMPLDPNGYKWRIHNFARTALHATVNQWSFTVPPDAVTDVPFNSGASYDTFVDLSVDARRDLDHMETRLLVELGIGKVDLVDPSDDLMVALTKAVAVGKMTQIMQGFIYRDGATVQRYENPKMEALIDLLEAAGGEPVLLLYHFREELEDLLALLGKGTLHLGAGVSDNKGARTVEAWNAGDIPVMPLHPASAGHGLNLQFGGRRLIWYHPTFSAELYIQTCKRLARPGQTLPVYSHRIRARHWLEDMRVNRVEGKIGDEKLFMEGLTQI